MPLFLRSIFLLAGLGLLGGLALCDFDGPLGKPSVFRYGAREDFHYPAVAVFAVLLLVVAALPGRVLGLLRQVDEALTLELATGSRRQRLIQLFIASAASLFLEIMLIRWLSVEVRIFAYFKNLALLIVFFGLGLGSLRWERPIRLTWLLGGLVLLSLLVKTSFLFPGASIPDLSFSLGGGEALYARSFQDAGGVLGHVAALACLFLLVLLLCLMVVPLGQVIGRHFRAESEPVVAYSVNVFASLLGIVSFSLVSWLGMPPWSWFAVGLALVMVLVPGGSRPRLMAAVPCLLLVFIASWGRPLSPEAELLWSPYHKVSWAPVDLDGVEEPVAYNVQINNAVFQRPTNLDPEFLKTLPKGVLSDRIPYTRYNVAYRLVEEPDNVLIVGAGTGNDVAAALRGGSKHVVAVEIDPALVELGGRIHPEDPYGDPRVEAVVNDARAYMNHTEQRFDLIVFATLDSHTLASGYTNVQLDHFVYTFESFQNARRLLKPNGLLVMPFDATADWLVPRFREMLTRAFEQRPLVFHSQQSVAWQWGKWMFVSGDLERVARARAADPRLDLTMRGSLPGVQLDAPVDLVPTDDWPYLYLPSNSVPVLYLEISALLVLLFLILARTTGSLRGGLELHFLFLGSAFMLLEFQGLTRLSLLFGSTWIVSSVVIAGILTMILLANLVVLRWRPERLIPAYLGLVASLVVSALLPPGFGLGQGLTGGLLATLLTVAPLFFAGIIFATSFSRSSDTARAYGSNLLGSVLGGLLVCLSFVIGIRAVVVVAAMLYGLSFLYRGRVR
ncbi:MAG: methyltransferase domain-containing protein [Acidobacteriota bacterium]